MNYRLIILSVLLISCLGCSGHQTAASSCGEAVVLSPVEHASIGDVHAARNGSSLEIEIPSVAKTGHFFHLELPAGMYLADEEWSDNSGLLQLTVPAGNGLDIGVVPLAGSTGMSVSAKLELTREPPRSTSNPPHLADNQVLRNVFSVDQVDGNRVLLDWTEVNIGDYDFDSEVSIVDLTPIAELFNRRYDRNAAGVKDTRIYWVDGDQNGEINQADIVPIAMHYRSVVAGYEVARNGEVLEIGSAEKPSIYNNRQIRPELPPLYSVVIEGHTGDDWDLTPVDQLGQEGTSLSDVVTEIASLNVAANIDGMNLYKLDGSQVLGTGAGYSLLRIIIDVEIIDGMDAPRYPIEVNNSQFFYGLPCNRPLYLQILYYPEYNPVTGERRAQSTATPGTPIQEDQLTVTTIPFYLPRDNYTRHLSVNISIAPNPAGGYYIYTQPALDPADALLPMYPTRLDYRTGAISCDRAGNGHYENNPQMKDLIAGSLSASRHDQLTDYLRYKDPAPAMASLTGQVLSCSMLTGKLVLQTPILATAFDSYTLPDTQVRFSENALFENYIKLQLGGLQTEMDPASLKLGDKVVLEVDLLGTNTPDQWNAIWLRHLIRVVPLDTTPMPPPVP